MEDGGFKVCPFCKEKIRKEAVKCRFCGEWLEQMEQSHSSSTAPGNVSPSPPIQRESPTPEWDKTVPVVPAKTDSKISPETLVCPHCKLVNPLGSIRCDCGYNFSSGNLDGGTGKRNPPKIFSRIGAILLAICGLVLFLGLKDVDWQHLSPMQVQGLTEATLALIFILIVAGSAASSVKRKGYKLFTFSIVCAISTAVGSHYFLEAQHNARQKASESDEQIANNFSTLEQFIEHGAIGRFPGFKPTGDTNMDMFFQTTSGFYKKYLQIYHKAGLDIQSLHEQGDFDDSVLTNKASLESEIQKRIVAQKIIQGFAANALAAVENYREECELLNVPSDYKTNFLNGIDKMSPRFKPMFDSWVETQRAEQNFLQFMDENFGGYVLKDGGILFDNETNGQKYAVLVRNLQGAESKAENFQKEGMAAVEAVKVKLQSQ